MMQCVANGHEIAAIANLKPPNDSGKGNLNAEEKKNTCLTEYLHRRA